MLDLATTFSSSLLCRALETQIVLRVRRKLEWGGQLSLQSSSLFTLEEILIKGKRATTVAEASVLWPPDAKSQLIGKDPDPGKY